MPKPTKGPRLGGSPAHERIILRNLASQLFEHGHVVTTVTKAKRVRPLAEKLINRAKTDTVANRRFVNRTITDRGIVHILFTEIGPRMEGRDGGYTRVTRIGNRKGDNAPMAVIEVISDKVAPKAPASAADAKAQINTATEPRTPSPKPQPRTPLHRLPWPTSRRPPRLTRRPRRSLRPDPPSKRRSSLVRTGVYYACVPSQPLVSRFRFTA
ncbi:LSU ribosomal protein L17p [Cutibacterium acnes JCM 18918]|nr:LSU ribosomal protein L17p [Cutibacterium acnes JCM 18918]